MRTAFAAAVLALVACRPPNPSACPPPAQGLFVTQILFQRGAGLSPTDPDLAISFTASGDALYVGSARVPVAGNYMGRIGVDRFTSLVNELVAAGLPEPGTPALIPTAPACGAAATLTLAYHTSGGRFAQIGLCAGSPEERRLLAPIYQLVEQTRWQPGGPALHVGLAR